MPGWMAQTSRFNPVDRGVQAARAPILPGTHRGALGIYLAALAATAALTTGFATWAFRSYEHTL